MGVVYKRNTLWWIRYKHEGKTFKECTGTDNRAEAVELLTQRMAWRPPVVEAEDESIKGLVYLVQENNAYRHTKIGFSTVPDSRIASMQTGNSSLLVKLLEFPGTKGHETYIHNLLKAFGKHIRGEWFSKRDAEFIIRVHIRYGPDIFKPMRFWEKTIMDQDTGLLEREELKEEPLLYADLSPEEQQANSEWWNEEMTRKHGLDWKEQLKEALTHASY